MHSVPLWVNLALFFAHHSTREGATSRQTRLLAPRGGQVAVGPHAAHVLLCKHCCRLCMP